MYLDKQKACVYLCILMNLDCFLHASCATLKSLMVFWNLGGPLCLFLLLEGWTQLIAIDLRGDAMF